MKKRNTYAVAVSSAAVGMAMLAIDVQAQSAFAGFYGQVSTGYESNQLGASSGGNTEVPNNNTDNKATTNSQTFGSAPLVLGAGYYWQVSDKWLVGLGADYSALTQTSSNVPVNITNASGNTGVAAGTTITGNGTSMQLSNRFSIFVTPGYAIDKDKLAYLKVGYSQVTAQWNRPTSATRTTNGVSTTTAGAGGNVSSNQSGYLFGLGYKQMITSGLYGFVEGNYMGYSAPSGTYTGSTTAINKLTGVTSTGTRTGTISFNSLNSYDFLIGVGYSF